MKLSVKCDACFRSKEQFACSEAYPLFPAVSIPLLKYISAIFCLNSIYLMNSVKSSSP